MVWAWGDVLLSIGAFVSAVVTEALSARLFDAVSRSVDFVNKVQMRTDRFSLSR